MSESTPLVLVDGSSYLYRAYHALPPLSTSSGAATGAVKGVINMLRRLCKDYPASTVAVVFDAKGKTFRDEWYPEYKANRPPMPDELREQVEPIHRIVRAMGLPLLCEPGVEADDVIGTLARQASEAGSPVIVSTGDKDMAQLVGERVTLVNTMTDTVLDRQGVQDKFGIPPQRIVDLLALMGDKVDNIPGVPGVGEKTALALLRGLGGLDAIYADLERVQTLGIRGAKTLAARLQKNKDSAYLSYRLATIATELALAQGFGDLANSPADEAALLGLFRELEFKSWVVELEAAGDKAARDRHPPKNKAPENKSPEGEGSRDAAETYDTVLDQASFERWLRRLEQAELFAFDTETTSLDYMRAEVVGVSFAVAPYGAAYLPLAHRYPGAPTQLDRDASLAALKPLLEDPARAKVGQNLKYDASVLARHGIALRGIAFDTMLESYVLDSTGSRHDMDTLALKYLGRRSFRTTKGHKNNTREEQI